MSDERDTKRLIIIDQTIPAPTITTKGIGYVNTSRYRVGGRTKVVWNGHTRSLRRIDSTDHRTNEDSFNDRKTRNKPPYRIPSMVEIATMPWNGFNVVSTFSGCGGSCLGYRMAGFRILWASEFVPSAADNYEANAAPGSVLDRRNIRNVSAEEVLFECGLRIGELDVLDGSPPCQSFSDVGKRHKGWGVERRYEGGHRQKNDDLFGEYVRLLSGLRPKCFVAENVSGMAKGVAKGYFLEMLTALKACGYRVSCRLLDAQWLGVPQARQRLVFVGVRNDIRDATGRPVAPQHPFPLSYRYSIRDAVPWIVDTTHNPRSVVTTTGDRVDPTLVCHPVEQRKFSIIELKRICAFPDDFVLTGSYSQQWTCLGNAVPPLMMRAIAETIRDEVLGRMA